MSAQDNSIIEICIIFFLIAVAICVISFYVFKNTPAHGILVGLIINLFIIGVFMSFIYYR